LLEGPARVLLALEEQHLERRVARDRDVPGSLEVVAAEVLDKVEEADLPALRRRFRVGRVADPKRERRRARRGWKKRSRRHARLEPKGGLVLEGVGGTAVLEQAAALEMREELAQLLVHGEVAGTPLARDLDSRPGQAQRGLVGRDGVERDGARDLLDVRVEPALVDEEV